MNKNKNSFKEDFQEHPVRFSLVFGVLFVALLVILIMNAGPVSEIWPTQKTIKNSINNEETGLKQIQKNLQMQLDELHKMEQDEDSFIKNHAAFWITERDGDPKVNMQKSINSAASGHGFTLSSVGAVRSDEITDGIYLMTTTIRGDGTLKSLIDFLGELQNMQPGFYWQSIQLRPKNPKEPSNIMMSGGIQIIAIDDEKITRLLIDK